MSTAAMTQIPPTQTPPRPILHGSGHGTLNWTLATRCRQVATDIQDVHVVVDRNDDGVETFRRCTAKHEIQTEITALDSGDITERYGRLHLRFTPTPVNSATHLTLVCARLFDLPLPKRLLNITADIDTTEERINSQVTICLFGQITLAYVAHLQKETAS